MVPFGLWAERFPPAQHPASRRGAVREVNHDVCLAVVSVAAVVVGGLDGIGAQGVDVA